MVLASLRVCLGLGATTDLPSHSTASRDAVEQSRSEDLWWPGRDLEKGAKETVR